jgi:PIN domain nuclease of toxin-antitoxin system
VLDASALLAYVKRERGWERVGAPLAGEEGCYISVVNLAEVLTKLADEGDDPVAAMRRLRNQGLVGQGVETRDLTEPQAVLMALFRGPTKRFGLSLGDRACLALAKAEGARAITTDRSWESVDVGVQIEVIR